MGQQLHELREEDQSCWMGVEELFRLYCRASMRGRCRPGWAAVCLRKVHLLGETGQSGNTPKQECSSTDANPSSQDSSRTHLPRGVCSYPGQMQESNQASWVWALNHRLLKILQWLAIALKLTYQSLTLLTSSCRSCLHLSPKLQLPL